MKRITIRIRNPLLLLLFLTLVARFVLNPVTISLFCKSSIFSSSYFVLSSNQFYVTYSSCRYI
ncbi:hypothetical protein HanRHA438_Chr05g0222971 [Helianthus annuus]|uniref:Uncharacterized protein n=1 Tax=Helianthus annuus TaxID=4232 RepID=A0A9K3NN09_HELAN|nr:hypothetical protein HanXRQr2_Chr05g0213611 [Helianthus annuus]KAJ0584497.1 hypothetical protein HanHA89_Chr05g0189311 [Helianthus annuus]KAJ0918868.1 hypothetical protein HanRHA438_Chr05g0222971 [Helianthus annuus]KAJ0922664.1 hypothetical protein HanPSC8_Chr05g0206511 [Helianthus annuus]